MGATQLLMLNVFSRLTHVAHPVQVDLCGHATLAAAHFLREAGILPPVQTTVRFLSKSCILEAHFDGASWVSLLALIARFSYLCALKQSQAPLLLQERR